MKKAFFALAIIALTTLSSCFSSVDENEASIIFYTEDETLVPIDVEVNGAYVGTISKAWTKAGAPDCGDTYGATYTVELGANTSQVINVAAENVDYTWPAESTTIYVGDCISLEIK